MSKKVILEAIDRSDIGKGASRRLRREQNLIPAVVYGANKDPQSISILHKTIVHSLEREGFTSSIITLKIDGKDQDVILKALQRHPYKPVVLHADFQRIDAKKAINVVVPIHLVGEAPGVKAGGLLSTMINQIEVSCLPKDLPEFLELDVSGLELDASLHLSDIVLPEGVIIASMQHDTDGEHDSAVVSVHEPRVVEEETDEEVAAEGEEGAEGDESSDAETAEADKPAE